MNLFFNLLGVLLLFLSCTNEATQPLAAGLAEKKTENAVPKKHNKAGVKTIHVFVALCDNMYQGIVPVGKIIGNGQDADNNLYWGCDNGIRTYFKKKSSDWIFLQSQKMVSGQILERILFKHKTKNVYLLADAYDGQFIKQTTVDFVNAAAGKTAQTATYKNDRLHFAGASNIVAYIGHDGLMDFQLPLQEKWPDTTKREAIVLACISKNYFAKHLQQTNAYPLLWTTGLMCPEAYTLHDALRTWINGKSNDEIQQAAAAAYARYQHCSVKAAKNLLVSGW